MVSDVIANQKIFGRVYVIYPMVVGYFKLTVDRYGIKVIHCVEYPQAWGRYFKSNLYQAACIII